MFVDPKNTSRECSVCHCIAKENRPSQAVFRCTNPQCRHQENADINAAEVIRDRAVRMILENPIIKKKSKKTMRLKRPREVIPACAEMGMERPGNYLDEELLLPAEHPTEKESESMVLITQCGAKMQETSHVSAR